MQLCLKNFFRFLFSCKKCLYLATTMILLVTGCAQNMQRSSFDPKNCFEIIPSHVEDLKIFSGQRTEKSIIRDMVPAVCHGHALFEYMKSQGKAVNPGTVLFRVVLEYTGEVYNVSIEETTIHSDVFLREVSDFIMDTDFVPWARHDTDTVFLYPAKFGY